MNTLLFDVAPTGSSIGIFLGIAFFFICLAVAVIVFKMLKKTVKMAFRMMIVGAILIAALIGTVAFFIFGSGSSKPYVRPTPPTQQKSR